MVGDVRPADRVEVPVNLAGWEEGGHTSPTVVVHAQSLRTALAGAPAEAARPLAVVLLTIAALVALLRDPRMVALSALLVALGLLAAAAAALRGGTHVALAGALFTLVAAVLVRAWPFGRA
jgi:CHASE2 domain-containing sensor protein